MTENPPQRSAIQYPKVTISDVLKEYGRVAKGFTPSLILMAVTTILVTICGGVVAPLFYKKLIDILTSSTPSPDVVSTLVSTILLIFLINLTGWLAFRIYQYAIQYMEIGVMTELRQNSYDYVIEHSYSFFTNTFAGSLVQKINRFMRSFERIADRFFSEILPTLTRVVGVCIVLWYTSQHLRLRSLFG